MPLKCGMSRKEVMHDLSHSQTKAGKGRSNKQNVAIMLKHERDCKGKGKKK